MTAEAQTTEGGYVYLISNPAWPGWFKTGKTEDPSERLSKYQTGDPLRAYRLEHFAPTDDHHAVEHLFRFELERLGYERSKEWFRVPLDDAKAILARVIEEHETGNPY
jgi:hypothetical protein